jgi:hypothetical protein
MIKRTALRCSALSATWDTAGAYASRRTQALLQRSDGLAVQLAGWNAAPAGRTRAVK